LGRDVRYLLDKFSQEDLRTWNRIADDADRYWVGLYHHLEAQRQINRKALVKALASVPSAGLSGAPWYRVIDFQYSLQPLSLKGSLTVGGRFNIGSDLDPTQFPVFPALYCGSDFETAYAEKFAVISSSSELEPHELALRTPESFTSVRLQIDFERLFDLHKLSNLKAFAAIIRKFTMSAELIALARELGKKPPWLLQDAGQLRTALLAADWRAFPMQFGIPANSQVFAGLLIEAGFQGVLYPSSKANGQCIAVFPQNFHDNHSSVRLLDQVPSRSCISTLHLNSINDLMA
jgi:hypothetical protein